jgi:hypothetical protein
LDPAARQVASSAGIAVFVAQQEDAYAPDRPRSATSPISPTPWRGRFRDYRRHEGQWIPFAGEVAWEINGMHEVYWQGKIESWEIA